MMKALLSFVTKGGSEVLPQKKFCDFMHFGSTKWIVIAYSTGIYIGIDKCSGPRISPGFGEIPPPPPLSVGRELVSHARVENHFLSQITKFVTCSYSLFRFWDN